MKKIVCIRLKELRGSLSQAKFASDLGLPQQTYANYETGRSEVGLSLLCDLASRFGVTTDWLLGLSDSKSQQPVAASAPISQAKLEGLKAAIRSLLDQY